MGRIFKLSFIYFMPIYMLISLLLMLKVGIYIYIWYPILFIIILLALKYVYSSRDGVTLFVTFFFLYCLVSVICYFFNETPIDCFFKGIKSFVIPILFFYLGSHYLYSEEFKNSYIISCVVCFIIGFYLYMMTPDFYRQFLMEAANSSWYNVQRSEEAIMETARFSSFFENSYAIEFLGGPCLILAVDRFLNVRGLLKKTSMLLAILVALLALFLSMQRAAIMFSVVFMTAYPIYILKKKNKSITPIFFVLSIIIICLIYLMFTNERLFTIFEMILDRFTDLDIKEDSSTRILNFDRSNLLSPIFGLGVGSAGQFAGAKGLQAIFDMEYIKDFYEFGILGFGLLLFIIILTTIRGLLSFYEHRTEVSIILFFLLCSLISNALTQYVNCCFFWYCIGLVWKGGKSISRHARYKFKSSDLYFNS